MSLRPGVLPSSPPLTLCSSGLLRLLQKTFKHLVMMWKLKSHQTNFISKSKSCVLCLLKYSHAGVVLNRWDKPSGVEPFLCSKAWMWVSLVAKAMAYVWLYFTGDVNESWKRLKSMNNDSMVPLTKCFLCTMNGAANHSPVPPSP